MNNRVKPLPGFEAAHCSDARPCSPSPSPAYKPEPLDPTSILSIKSPTESRWPARPRSSNPPTAIACRCANASRGRGAGPQAGAGSSRLRARTRIWFALGRQSGRQAEVGIPLEKPESTSVRALRTGVPWTTIFFLRADLWNSLNFLSFTLGRI